MATTMARPRQPKSGYRNKYYDPVAAHKYYLSRRKLKGYKDRYKNSDRRRKRGDEDEETQDETKQDPMQQDPMQQERDREDEEREAEELLELAEEQDEEQESSRKLYAHTGDKRTGIHAARGWTVMHTQEANMAARGAEGKANAQTKDQTKDDGEINTDIVPEGYVLPDEVQRFVDLYDELVTRIATALESCDEQTAATISSQLDSLSDTMKNLVAGKAVRADTYGRAGEINAMRQQIQRYNRSMGR